MEELEHGVVTGDFIICLYSFLHIQSKHSDEGVDREAQGQLQRG